MTQEATDNIKNIQ